MNCCLIRGKICLTLKLLIVLHFLERKFIHLADVTFSPIWDGKYFIFTVFWIWGHISEMFKAKIENDSNYWEVCQKCSKLIKLFRRNKMIWHGSTADGRRDPARYCDGWRSSSTHNMGLAADLRWDLRNNYL